MLLPQLATLVQLTFAGLHSPTTRLAASPSVKLLGDGLVTSSTYRAAPPGPSPPTSHECHWPPKNRSPAVGVASTKKAWAYWVFEKSTLLVVEWMLCTTAPG